MMTRSGYQMATSFTKSHSPPRAAKRSTYSVANWATAGCSLARFSPRNQPCVSARYLAWSGSSICTSERTGCLRPVSICTCAITSRGPRMGRGSWMKTRPARSISFTSAYLATDQNGSNPSGRRYRSGWVLRSQRNCSCMASSSAQFAGSTTASSSAGEVVWSGMVPAPGDGGRHSLSPLGFASGLRPPRHGYWTVLERRKTAGPVGRPSEATPNAMGRQGTAAASARRRFTPRRPRSPPRRTPAQASPPRARTPLSSRSPGPPSVPSARRRCLHRGAPTDARRSAHRT